MPALLEPAVRRPGATRGAEPAAPRRDLPFTPVCTLVVWLFCLTVGTIGLSMPYARPSPPAKPLPALRAEVIQVELARETLPAVNANSALPTPQAPPAVPLVNPPPALPAMVSVAEASTAAVPFPVAAPVQMVRPNTAIQPAEAVETAPAQPVPVQSLTFGYGEARQPAPDYPLRARREGQEGVVRVQFTVGENGRVLSAQAIQRTPWPLLNDAAVSAVRQRWRFQPGPVRLYEVSIRFQLASNF